MKIYKNKEKDTEISSIEEWKEFCPPMNPKKQWVDKRSAKEMAKYWLDRNNQNSFLLFLKQFYKDLTFNYAIPEIATKFDNYSNSRKNDLCIYGNDGEKEILCLIEGKSDEHFGKNYVHKEWMLSIQEKLKNKNSKKLNRITELYNRFNNNSNFLYLRYQLTYWFAGAIEEALRENIDTVFLIAQEFLSEITKKRKITINQMDLDFFVKFISLSEFDSIKKNEIIGPINNHFTKGVNIYIGKYHTAI